MKYPEKLLGNDEEVLKRLHPHWITIVPAAIWLVLITGGSLTLLLFVPFIGSSGAAQLALAVVVFVLLTWRVVTPWLRRMTTHYVFTNRRVLIRTGILRHQGHDIALQRITDVAFNQSLIERIIRSGTIVIESAGEHGQEILRHIPRSAEMQQLINLLLEEDLKNHS